MKSLRLHLIGMKVFCMINGLGRWGGLWVMGSGLGSRTRSWGSWSCHIHTARKFVDRSLCFEELLMIKSCEQTNISCFFHCTDCFINQTLDQYLVEILLQTQQGSKTFLPLNPHPNPNKKQCRELQQESKWLAFYTR